jgi:hypothetical protein
VTACRQCHQEIVDTYRQTAHFNTSAPADSVTVKGPFAEGANILRTRDPKVQFTMESRRQGYYQRASDLGRMLSRAERFELTIGSGRKGQSYLYWRGGRLFQLPVSYLTASDGWVNSPGYHDGVIDFDRPIGPRCLECHSTTFQLADDPSGLAYQGEYRLGITCEKCHGDGRDHIARSTGGGRAAQGSIVNPATIPRDRQIDICALCHSGVREPTKPAFSFRPGEPLADYFRAEPDSQTAAPDVHGNQIALLRLSKCYRASPRMSCATCHDVHRPQRDLADFVPKCLSCHQSLRHQADLGERLVSSCIDCHMPDQRSNALQFNTPTTQFAPSYRNHRIAVYSGR